jgi:hypothetical protein
MGNLYYNHCGVCVDKLWILKQPAMARSDGHLLPLYLYLDGCINQPLCSLVVILMQSCMKKPTLVSWPVNTTTPTADSVFCRLQPWTKSNSPVTDCRYHKENAFNHELQRQNWGRDQMDVALPEGVSGLVK